MADIHVEEFYRDVAIALSQLYSAFPRRINLFVEDIAGQFGNATQLTCSACEDEASASDLVKTRLCKTIA